VALGAPVIFFSPMFPLQSLNRRIGGSCSDFISHQVRGYFSPPWIRRLQRLKNSRIRLAAPIIPETEKLTPDPRLKRINPIPYMSKRTGVLAYKIGSMSMWDEWGERHMVTVCKLQGAQVTAKKTIAVNGYEAVQVGLGNTELKRMTKERVGDFIKKGVSPKAHLSEFRVTSECLIPEGVNLTVRHFVPGQWVFVSGWSQPKGFKSVIGRWNFSGMETQGTTKGIRRPGSVGQGHSASLVYKGKRMGGHKGPDPRCVNCKVFRTESHRQLIFLKGSVPGDMGSVLKISDGRGRTRRKNRHIRLPYPTFVPKEGVEYPVTVTQPPLGKDPFAYPDRTIYDRHGK
jgi:large subunit ribosomal protein L3